MLRDQDCDVEPLTVGDFEEYDSAEMMHFVIQQAKLAGICEYLPPFSSFSYSLLVFLPSGFSHMHLKIKAANALTSLPLSWFHPRPFFPGHAEQA